MPRRFAFLLLSALLIALIAVALCRRAPITAQDRPAGNPPINIAAKRELQGASSCSASVCHGGNAIGARFSELLTWQARDPHARAYDALLTADSQAIAQRYWTDGTPAHAAPLCLKCHVHPEYDHARPDFRKQDGVGCEGCHGAAQDWLKPHYRAGWQQADKTRFGFADTKHLRGRAEICVPCHVGTPDANVDHDLIAAGHPALRFEFATYLANLPAHWCVERDKQFNSPDEPRDFELRAWAEGQAAALACSLELLAFRADPANHKPWPELAEFDCFSCHHDLAGEAWRQDKRHLDNRRPGSLTWNSWYPKPAEWLADPSRVKIAVNAAAYAKEVRRQEPLSMPFYRDWANEKNDAVARNWDEATRRYLFLLTFRAAQKTVDAPLNRRIADLRAQVTIPNGFASPRGFLPPALPKPK